jgi:16S rRNA (adenine1518-N6/adenine1519-N6)-dimethyltransferase
MSANVVSEQRPSKNRIGTGDSRQVVRASAQTFQMAWLWALAIRLDPYLSTVSCLLHSLAMARQKLGQHFLGDTSWQHRIFETLPKDPNDVWIEIGPGHGEMTQLLASGGRRVIGIETDPLLVEGLRKRMRVQSEQFSNTEIVPGDILTTDLAKVAPGQTVRVYGNLPYYITSPILHRLFAIADRILSIHIVIQLEVAQRIAAGPGSRAYGYLSAACQFYANPKIALKIPGGAFRPPPRVTSALVEMSLPGKRKALNIPDEARFFEFVRVCFGQKRKTLRNNLRSLHTDELIHASLAGCGLRSDARAEQLPLAQFAELFKKLNGLGEKTLGPAPANLPGRRASGPESPS